MNEVLKNDLLQLDSILEVVKQSGIDYLHQLAERPTSAKPASGDGRLPEKGMGTKKALNVFNDRFEPSLVASSGPRYWGFVTGGSTPAAIAGDWLTSVYDQNTQAIKGHGDVSANIELETISLLRELLTLPSVFDGGFVTGATMSNFTCLAVARQWAGRANNADIAGDGLTIKIPVVAATPHSSAIKSLAMLGIGSRNINIVKTVSATREAIDVTALEQAIAALNGSPFILISSAGTVNTVDFDDFVAISSLKSRYKFWWHIDAAFGGFAACSDQYKHLVSGWEQADSITVDCHKWLNVPYESAVYFINHVHHRLQIETFQNSNAPYLGNAGENFNYLNLLPENSRRLKALPAWFTLMAYGKDGYKEMVDHAVNVTRIFADFIEESEWFELLAPVRLNTVCFSLRGEPDPHKVKLFLSRLNDTEQVFMTPTFFNGRSGIRAAFVNYRTTIHDIAIARTHMQQIASGLTAT